MGLATGVTKVLTGVGNVAGATALGLKYVRDQATLFQKRQKFLSAMEIPEEVNIIDLFHKKIFKYVDFDGVIEYLRSKGLSNCQGLYTIHSLSYELIPEVTEHAFESRDTRSILGLYGAVIRLCRRYRGNLLLYLDQINNKLYPIKSVEKFLTYVSLTQGVMLDDLDIPCKIALPQVSDRDSKQTQSSSSATQRVFSNQQTAQQAANNSSKTHLRSSRRGSSVPTPVSINKSDVNNFSVQSSAFQAAPASPLAGQPSLFNNTPEDFLRSILTKISLNYTELSKIEQSKAFDALFFYTLYNNSDYKNLIVNYQHNAAFGDFYNGIDTVLSKYGYSLSQLLPLSNGEFFISLRLAAKIPDGNGYGNSHIQRAVLQLYADTFKDYQFVDIKNNQRNIPYLQLLKEASFRITMGQNSVELRNMLKDICEYSYNEFAQPDNIFELALFRALFHVDSFKPVINSFINGTLNTMDFCSQIERMLLSYGFQDFGRLVFYSSGIVGKSFRIAYGLAEGTGASNAHWMKGLQIFYKSALGIESVIKTLPTVEAVCTNLLTQLENKFRTDQTASSNTSDVDFDNLEQFNDLTL